MADKIPASIRTNNPGAMWGGTRAQKWGATDDLILSDGQRNHIAVFPTKVQGAAAQFDLWASNYRGLSLQGAIRKWCGGNSPAEYVAFIEARTGIQATDFINTALLSGPKGLALMKAQAAWECGLIKDGYPMTDAEWVQAQHLVFTGANPAPPPDIPPAPPPPAPTGWIEAVIRILSSIFKRS